MAARNTSPLTATRTPLRVKEENDGDSLGEHSHQFTVKFGLTERKEYTIHCKQSGTVLETIKSNLPLQKFEMIKCADENIIIQLGKKDKEFIVATHFPCCCVGDGESLIVLSNSEKIEKVQEQQNGAKLPKDAYSVFYIDTVGGSKTKTKKLFRSNMVKDFKNLCVYGEKGMTVEEAVKRDGRFADNLGDFTLTDNENPNIVTVRTQIIDNLHQKAFKICLPMKKSESGEKPTSATIDVVHERGKSVKSVLEQQGASIDNDEIYKLLCQQFPDLKEWMENRFPENSYQEALNLRKENFGKIQQSFSEVHRIEKLLKMGKSVCKIIVKDDCQGTGFVLFGHFILTNAHLFKSCVEGKKLQEPIEVFAVFNYEDPETEMNYFYFTAEKTFADIDDELDYAILELKPEGHKPNQQTENIKVPAGLLKNFGPLPENGEACLIGHPAGAVKKMDPTCIIEPHNREKAVNDHLAPFKHTLFILQPIIEALKNRGIEDIMMHGPKAEKVVTDNTVMYHGSSGSPVFDGHGQVFGLHTGGFFFGFPKPDHSVIEFCFPLLIIFKKFVSSLKKVGHTTLLDRVREEAKGNPHLEKILAGLMDESV